ncbi:MAG: VWA domain-containing protein [Nitrososphaerota archaeon]
MQEFVILLANRLRLQGVRCGVSESIDGCIAAESIPIRSVYHLREVLRLAMIKRVDDYEIFDRVFEELLNPVRKLSRPEESTEKLPGESVGEQRKVESSSGQSGQSITFYSPMEVLMKRMLPAPTHDSFRQSRRVIRRLRRRLALLPGRRSELSSSGLLDFPHTIRTSLRTYGEFVRISHSSPKITRCRLIALFDVSGSMDAYTGFLMQSMYALARQGVALEVFVFSTKLVRVSDMLRYFGPKAAAEKISEDIHIWGSGTRIGSCLQTFLHRYGGLVSRGTVVMIVSDGWDTGEPELLDRVMRELKNRSGRIVWINPHADKPGFKPRTVGMETAMPYVDLLAGMASLQNMRGFVRFFGNALQPIMRKPVSSRLGSPSQ